MKQFKFVQMQQRMIQDVLNWTFNPANAALINAMAPFKAAAATLQTQSGNITDLFARYLQILKGIAQARRDARTALAEESYTFMQAARAYFISINNLDAAAQMDISLSRLKATAYTRLSQLITSVQSTISPVVPDLVPYNITLVKFTAWQTTLNNYNNLESAHAAIAQRKAIGTQIQTAMTEAMNHLRTQCDTTVHSIASEEFIQTYFNNRRLVRQGIHHTGLHLQLENELGQPFGPGINVTVDAFIKNDRTFSAASASTDNTGAADVSAFEPGQRTITVSGQGVVEKTYGPYIFEKGRILDLTLTAQPQFSNVPAPKPEKISQPVTKG